ncbi:MAG: hypothetical protein WBN75_13355 [Verrucomicrobiia bacterium]
MLAITKKIVRSGLESDPTLSPADRTRLMAVPRLRPASHNRMHRLGLPALESPAIPATLPVAVRCAALDARFACAWGANGFWLSGIV